MARSTNQINADLTIYYAARQRVAKNQSYTIGTRTFTMANASILNKIIQDLEKELNAATHGGGIRPRKIIFRDD